MANSIGKVSDFIIRVIMMFTTIVVLLFLSNNVQGYSLIFGFLALLFVLAIITKGIYDIFSKE